MKLITKPGLVRIGVLFAVLGLLIAVVSCVMIRMPGRSHAGPLPPLTPSEGALRDELRRDVEMLGGRIGVRDSNGPLALTRTMEFIEGELRAAGYEPRRLPYERGGQAFANIEARLGPASGPVVVVGAHYDSAGTPGANDNGSGVAATLALARRFAKRRPNLELRFVAFANEEPPFFQTDGMGSLVYARALRAAGADVRAMVSLETMGCYRDEPGTQRYPYPLSVFYPDRGNFIAFVGNVGSRDLVRRAIGTFRDRAAFPSEGAALPAGLPGVGWSDHWSFWQAGYPAIMVTDTAPFRYDEYHTQHDLPAEVDCERLARVVAGLEAVVAELVEAPP